MNVNSAGLLSNCLVINFAEENGDEELFEQVRPKRSFKVNNARLLRRLRLKSIRKGNSLRTIFLKRVI